MAHPFLAYLSCALVMLATPLASTQVLSRAAFGQQERGAYQRGLVALKEDRLEDALGALTLAVSDQPDDASIHNFRGIVLARLERFVEAAAEYHEAIHLDPSLEAADRNLGFLEWHQHQLDLARGDLEAALRLSPGDLFAHYYLGRVELELQAYEAAFRELQTSAMPLPDEPDVQMLAAHGYLAVGKLSKASQIARQLAPRRLTAAQTSHLAALLLATQDRDAAILLLQRWKGDKGSSESWAGFDLGLAYLAAGKFQQAADAATRSTYAEQGPLRRSIAPAQAAEAFSLLGVAEAHLRVGDHGLGALRRATLLAPAVEEHWLNLTRELMELGKFAEAVSAVQDAIRVHPRSYALQLRLGAVYLSLNRYADAEKVFGELIVAGDPLPTSAVGLAQVMLRTGRAEEAVAELATARETLGSSFLLSYFQGLALNRAGKPEEAAPMFQEALQMNANSAEAHFELGKTELKRGRLTGAIVELESAQRLNPDDPQTRRLLDQARFRAGGHHEVRSGASEASEPATLPQASDLAGDFILPSWREPSARIGNSTSPLSRADQS